MSEASFLLDKGYVKLPSGVLSRDQLSVLQRFAEEKFGSPAIPYAEPGVHRQRNRYEFCHFTDDNWAVLMDVVGADAAADAVMEHIFSHPAVRSVLAGVSGPGYKIFQAAVRRAHPGGRGMDLHQDTPGEIGLTILLDDTGRDGATVLLPTSHRWPIGIGDLGFSPKPRALTPLLAATTGQAGDMYFFINHAWHGRYPHGKKPVTALMFALMTAGARYRLHTPQAEVLTRLQPELRRLLDPAVGVKLDGDGMATVQGAPLDAQSKGALFGAAPSEFSPWRLVKGWAACRRMVRQHVLRRSPPPPSPY